MPEPPAAPVGSLVYRNPVHPSLQAGLAVEMLHPPEDLEENFLRGVGGIGWIRYNAINQAIDRLVELANQPGVCLLRTRLQFGHDGGFLGPNTYRSCEITQDGCSRHDSHGVTPIIGSFRAASPFEK